MCGASKGEKLAGAQIRKTSNALYTSFQKIYADNSAILGSITNALTPIVKGGASQYGFSAAEDAALRTQATAELARAGRSASGAVRSALASRGGGNVLLPSGSEASIEAGLAENEAYKQAEAQLDITGKGYETGRENFFRGTGMLGAAPGELEAPITRAGGAAMSGSQAYAGSEKYLAAAGRRWMKPVAGIIGAGLTLATGGAAAPVMAGMGGFGGGDDQGNTGADYGEWQPG